MSISLEKFKSQVNEAINIGQEKDIKRLIELAKAINALDELKLLEDYVVARAEYPIRYQGKTYSSIKKLADYLGIHENTLEDRIKKGLPESKWNIGRSQQISYKGKYYKSIIDLANYLKVPRTILYKRIRDEWPEERWSESILKNERENRIIERYRQGDSVKKLAISFGLKMDHIRELLDKNSVLKKEDKQIKTYRVEYANRINRVPSSAGRKQLNLRLNDDYNIKISKIRSYWAKRGSFDYLGNKITDKTVLNSETTFAKFILEKSLDNLSLELEIELNIDKYVEKICSLRIEDKLLNKDWEQVKIKHFENGIFKSFISKELEKYQNRINQISDKIFEEDSENETMKKDETLQQKLLKIAIKKSYLVQDKASDSSVKDLIVKKMINIIDEKYSEI